jgi:Two component regulator propeller
MRITSLPWAGVWALVCLACFPFRSVAAPTFGTDTWVTLPASIPPFAHTPNLATDSARNLYFHGPEGIFLLEAGSLRALPLPEAAGFRPGSFLPLSEREYWIRMTRSGPEAETEWLLFRYRSGQWTRYDSTLTCIRGVPLGLDAAGNPILELRTSHIFSSTSQGVFRLVDGQCREIALGLELNTQKLATRYFRDSRGREYFALKNLGDVPACAGFVRLTVGTLERWETFEFDRDPLGTSILRMPICAHDFEESGDTLFLASSPGLAVLVDTAITYVRNFRGVRDRTVSDVLKDSRGYLWLGTEGYPSSAAPLGLVRIQGSDTASMHKENSDLPSLYPHGLWEDRAGNIWVRMFEGGFAVLLREGNPSPLGLAPRIRRLRAWKGAQPDQARDFLGRAAHPSYRSVVRPKVPPSP